MSHVTDNLETECDTELELEAEAEGLAQISQCENISDTVTGHIFRYEPRKQWALATHDTIGSTYYRFVVFPDKKIEIWLQTKKRNFWQPHFG